MPLGGLLGSRPRGPTEGAAWIRPRTKAEKLQQKKPKKKVRCEVEQVEEKNMTFVFALFLMQMGCSTSRVTVVGDFVPAPSITSMPDSSFAKMLSHVTS